MSKRVLVAPLDWGLGHATRCIPVIQELLQQGAEVVLASDGRSYQLLQHEFPGLIIEKMPSYNIQYHTHNMLWNMMLQAPKIAQAIWREHQYLKKLIKKHRINYVIADNRFGCFNKNVKTVFITHQVNIRLPDLLGEWGIRLFNRFFINRFDEYWIPDVQGKNSIAGELASPYQSPKSKFKYIGILSRMKPMDFSIKYDAIIVLSGPEPQRTRLETLILQQIYALPYCFLLVQGKPEKRAPERPNDQANVKILPFLDTENLNKAMAASEIVICRSGYSTIMDLAKLGKKALFIPTPGQTEQEYLAARLFEKGLFYYQKQTALNLVEALQKVKDFSGFKWQDYQDSKEMLQKALNDFLHL